MSKLEELNIEDRKTADEFTPPAPSRAHALGAIPDEAVSSAYAKKAHALNSAIQEIGMGRYQWGLFCVAGFGWCADNVYVIVVLILLGLMSVVVAASHSHNPPICDFGAASAAQRVPSSCPRP